MRVSPLLLLLFSTVVAAQSYPSRPVKVIVAFAPGGGNDLIARFIAPRLSSALGQQFIVENRPVRAAPSGSKPASARPPTATRSH